jgi:hypothetical protein
MVTAHSPYIYAYTTHQMTTKAAKILGGTVLTSLRLVEGAYRIEKLADNGGAYPPAAEWWVAEGAVEITMPTPEPAPEPAPGTVTASEAAAGLTKFLEWYGRL